MAETELNNDDISRKLAQSLESTRRGLVAFSNSVSTLQDALTPYQQMQVVLMQQRLWARTHSRDELNPLWEKIAESSEALYRVFAGFARVMNDLRSIDRVELQQSNTTAQQPIAGPLSALETTEAKADCQDLHHWSDAALVNFKLAPSHLAKIQPTDKNPVHLNTLVQAKILERTGRGSYRFTVMARNRLAKLISEMSNGQSIHT
jgi:hypothetical protein